MVGSRRPVKKGTAQGGIFVLLVCGEYKNLTNLVSMRTSDKDDRSLFGDLVGTAGSNLSEEDVEE